MKTCHLEHTTAVIMGKAEYLAEGQEPSVRQNRDLDDLSAVLGQLELEVSCVLW